MVLIAHIVCSIRPAPRLAQLSVAEVTYGHLTSVGDVPSLPRYHRVVTKYRRYTKKLQTGKCFFRLVQYAVDDAIKILFVHNRFHYARGEETVAANKYDLLARYGWEARLRSVSALM